MSYQFTVQVDRSMMKQAWNAWAFRNERRLWPLGVALLVLGGSVGMELRGDGLSTWTTVELSILASMGLLYTGLYFVGLRRSLSKLDAIVDGRAEYTLTETRIEAQSSLGSLSLNWSAVAELRRYQNLTLLGFRGAQYSTLPTAQVPAEAHVFLVDRCRAAGAKMIDL